MRIMDFTLCMYEKLCESLRDYLVVTMEEYLSQETEEPLVVLRHDVDRELGNALAVAKLEYRYGIRSTYYFRYPRTYDVKVLSLIQSMGHEIGYHYEVLDKARGNPSKAIAIFQEELSIFRQNFPVKTVCMHGNPLTKWDGRSIWNFYDIRDFALLGEAYRSCQAGLLYITDTGRNWKGNSNIKDTLGPHTTKINVNSTTELIDCLNKRIFSRVYLNCHPERWGPGLGGWARAFFRDQFFNFCKTALKHRVLNEELE